MPLKLALLLSFCLPAFTQSLQPLNTVTAAQVIIKTHDAGDFDGVVILAQAGKPILTRSEGFADRTRHRPNTPETVFRLASFTKQVTSLLVMQQVDAHRIALDQKAGDILPTLSPAAARVTIRQLLQHVSGLANPSDGPDNIVPAFYQRTASSEKELAASSLHLCTNSPKRDPGGPFEYNNCDYIVLGAILEHLTGMSYSALVQTKIVRPLGLKSWGVFPPDPAKAPKTAIAYQTDGAPDVFQNPATYGPAAALYGNALDVSRWNDALLQHKLLSPEATEIMFHADPKLYGEALGSWAYDLPGVKPAIHLIERQGDIGGTHLLNLLLPAQNASLIIIANTERADLFNTYSQKGLGYAILKPMFTPEPEVQVSMPPVK